MSPTEPDELARRQEAAEAGRGEWGGYRMPETVVKATPALQSCETKLLSSIRGRWALAYGTREVRLLIEYQDGVPVLIRVTGNRITEEKLR